MKLFLTFAITALTMFAQDAKPQEKTGMFWHWFDGAKKCDVEWDTAAKTRIEAFKNLDAKVADGDPAKIRLYMSKVYDAQFKISMAWACGSDYSRNLNEAAGAALNNAPDSLSINGHATEAEYDQAMALVKTLRKKIADRPLTDEQKKSWEVAVKAIGQDPTDVFYKLEQ